MSALPFNISAALDDADLTLEERREFHSFATGWFFGSDPKACEACLADWLAFRAERQRKAA